MDRLKNLQPKRVFEYFERICEIPHGSQNMKRISDFIVKFAKEHSLQYVKDGADNVIVFKPASRGYSDAEPVILQGHLDMVCQKTADCRIDFLLDALDIYVEGDFIRARGTSLGADNGIAVAMMLAVLEDDTLPHPAIEAVFTTDEEIGMIGASRLDFALLTAKRMINLDSEEDDTVTVSCAGGSDLEAVFPINRTPKSGTEITVSIYGLKGGHSGVEIDKGRMNANVLLGRVLNSLDGFDIICIDGGDKANAIPCRAACRLCAENADEFEKRAKDRLSIIKNEISDREPNFTFSVQRGCTSTFDVFTKELNQGIIYTLVSVPNGVQDMSRSIKGLVETSLNLGILQTDDSNVAMHFALRSNKNTSLKHLEDRLLSFFADLPCNLRTFGHYPSWEFKQGSKLQELYEDCYKRQNGQAPKVEAIHAGLECGVFSAGIEGLECIAIGPTMYDVHTTNERLSISSTQRTFELILKMLEYMK